jgi:hypothetical protein
MELFKFRINLSNLAKEKLYHGSKGIYLNGVIIKHDTTDQYGKDGIIIQEISEEERKEGKKGNVLGNIIILSKAPADPDDLPF